MPAKCSWNSCFLAHCRLILGYSANALRGYNSYPFLGGTLAAQTQVKDDGYDEPEAAVSSRRLTPFEQLRYARQVVQQEGRTLAAVAQRLDAEFCRAVELLYQCRGNVIVSGMGKAGLIGQKIMATLASTGTPAIACIRPRRSTATWDASTPTT